MPPHLTDFPCQDNETREITPKILGHIKTRLEQVFMRISSVSANDSSLKNIAQMTSAINRMIEMTKPRNANPY